MKMYVRANLGSQKSDSVTYTAYADDCDMTFILIDTYVGEDVVSTECVGFYFGEPNDADTKRFAGSLTAKYTL